MEELAQVVNDTRMGVSRALNSMQEKGLPNCTEAMMIPDAEKPYRPPEPRFLQHLVYRFLYQGFHHFIPF